MLTALYLGAVSAGFVLLAASVVHELFFRPADSPGSPSPTRRSPPESAGASADPLDPEARVRCHRDVTDLYGELGRISGQLMALPREASDPEIMPRWQAFSRKWLKRWDDVAARCRFFTLADRNRGKAYDRMAQVHGELPALRLEYHSLLVRFNDDQAADLARLKRELDRSRAELMRQQAGVDEEAP